MDANAHRGGLATQVDQIWPEGDLFTRLGGRQKLERIVDGLVTPLHHAVRGGQVEIVRTLLERGARIRASPRGSTRVVERGCPHKAVFESTGEATWNVSFHFNFDEDKHVYAGTAEGSLTEGELHGRVMTDGEKPSPFEFEGTFSEGSFTGKHVSLRGDEPEPTGTMTLSR